MGQAGSVSHQFISLAYVRTAVAALQIFLIRPLHLAMVSPLGTSPQLIPNRLGAWPVCRSLAGLLFTAFLSEIPKDISTAINERMP